jgi:PAS domain-containing protein
MDGYEFMRQLRLNPMTTGIPVVFYTAHYGEREARALALSSGVAYVLTKPVESGEVLRIVGRVLAGVSDPRTPPDALPLTPAFDREHLQLLTDKLSKKAGDLRAANARLRALINIGLELASERDPDRLLQSVCIGACDVFAATYVTLGILNRHDRTVERFVSYGADAATWIKVGDAVSGILAKVVAERRTVRIENPDGDPARLQLPLFHPEVRAFLAAPIASPSHVYGWICFVGNEGRATMRTNSWSALSGQVGRITNGYLAWRRSAAELERRIPDRRAESALRQGWIGPSYLDTAQVILLALDLEGRITLINRKGCELLGWTEGELPDATDRHLSPRPHPRRGRTLLGTLVSVPCRREPHPHEARRAADRMAQHRAARRGGMSSARQFRRRHHQRQQAVSGPNGGRAHAVRARGGRRSGTWTTTGIHRWSVARAHTGCRTALGRTFQAFVSHSSRRSRMVLETIRKAVRPAPTSRSSRAIWPDGTLHWRSAAAASVSTARRAHARHGISWTSPTARCRRDISGAEDGCHRPAGRRGALQQSADRGLSNCELMADVDRASAPMRTSRGSEGQ